MKFPESTPLEGDITRVTAAAADTLILARNLNRNGALIFNESTAILYLCLSKQAASPTNYSVQIGPGGFYINKYTDYAGEIRGYWATATGAAQVTEFV